MPTVTNIQVDARTAEALAEYAVRLGMSVSDFLERHFVGGNGNPSISDADQWLDDVAEGTDDLPVLPEDFSTRDLYSDHD